ncbi:hypothetical protein EYF80_058609 [Liparis tanakae]|uniref:Uncharacterized protein n=1 Tax=Liparis tanakae TaxID=230148 RepID=A0A4Z2ERK6_9TELE|nr:hypothetical protein EYF80_058609 [Liparis tanakae]
MRKRRGKWPPLPAGSPRNRPAFVRLHWRRTRSPSAQRAQRAQSGCGGLSVFGSHPERLYALMDEASTSRNEEIDRKHYLDCRPTGSRLVSKGDVRRCQDDTQPARKRSDGVGTLRFD